MCVCLCVVVVALGNGGCVFCLFICCCFCVGGGCCVAVLLLSKNCLQQHCKLSIDSADYLVKMQIIH